MIGASATLNAFDGIAVRLGLPANVIENARAAARANATHPIEELIAAGIDEGRIYAAFAELVGLPFISDIDPEAIMLPARAAQLRLTDCHLHHFDDGDGMGLLSAPPITSMDGLLAIPAERLRRGLRIAPPRLLADALLARTAERRATIAANGLFDIAPGASARITATPMQGAVIGFLCGVLPGLWMLFPAVMLTGFHMFASLFFLACVALRAMALSGIPGRALPPIAPYRAADLPRYAVIVALYREGRVVPQLVAALKRLNWPKSKLEIWFACEADDAETLAAFRSVRLPPWMRVVAVPDIGPRTKPKALMHVLPMVDAPFVALYDAEDRPHPDQLLEAWQALEAGGERCATAQAPLVITRRSGTMIEALFAFEYSALFRGLLPKLASWGVAFPLGGTSNHFRTAALLRVGGWDPHNVTEDADLGFRLARAGFAQCVIARPTLEDAPHGVAIWLRQRTRWFKGWMQTWLVLMRAPRRALGEMGWRSFAAAQVFLAGMIASALCHPLLVACLISFWATLASGDAPAGTLPLVLLAVDAVNIVLGYGAFVALGWATLSPYERQATGLKLLAVPLYWMMLSFAAWRAVAELVVRPHYWAKTPHLPAFPVSPRPSAVFPGRPSPATG